MPLTYKLKETQDDEPHYCALCDIRLDDTNDSREHIIPNAIGGRKSIRKFICRQCNNTTGATWDNQLATQLQPLCTMLDIRRGRGKNQPTAIQSVKGEKLSLRPDGSMTIQKPIFSRRKLAGSTVLNFKVNSIEKLNEMIPGLKRKYPNLDTDELLQQATLAASKRKYLQDPWCVKLEFGGESAGRSIIKSLLALVYDAERHISDCEHAKGYLLSGGEACFGYYNETDIVKDRPPGTYLHCIYICGDPRTKQLLGYAEYFGYQKIVACLSSNYDGESFSHCYAIDPVTGEELDIDINLEFTPEDIAAIYAYEKVDDKKVGVALDQLMATWKERDIEKATEHAVKDAAEFAFANCGARPGEIISDEQILKLISLVLERLVPFVLHLRSSSTFSQEDLQNIAAHNGLQSNN